MDGSHDDGLFRNPQVIRGPVIASAEDLGETVDWGLKNHEIADIHKITTGEGTKVAILDTGEPVHKDLGDPAFSHNTTKSKKPYDVDGHSTHVCGTISAKANGFGVRGVAPGAAWGTIKVLGDDGAGYNSWIRDGIYKAIDEKVDVLSMSLGGGYDRGIEQACIDAVQSGIFVICAAGNDGYEGRNTVNWPAKLASTIAVASYNSQGQISEFSSGGKEVDFAFPGEQILSTWPNNQYRRISGTSMATPFCSAAVLLYVAYLRKVNPAKVPTTNGELREVLKGASKDMGPDGHDVRWGWGIPNLSGLVTAVDKRPPATEPSIPVTGENGPGLFLGPMGLQLATLNGKQGLFIFLK